MLTIHMRGKGNDEQAVASQQETAPHLKLLGVTVLTSMDAASLNEIGLSRSPEEQVLSLAGFAGGRDEWSGLLYARGRKNSRDPR